MPPDCHDAVDAQSLLKQITDTFDDSRADAFADKRAFGFPGQNYGYRRKEHTNDERSAAAEQSSTFEARDLLSSVVAGLCIAILCMIELLPD